LVHGLVCESEGVIGTTFFGAGEECLVGLLVSEDDVEHIWWFRKAEPPDAVW
jgi:hypothetical protein